MKNQKGFTLVESLVSIAILSVIILASIVMTVTNRDSLFKSVKKRSRDVNVNNITDSIRNNPTLYQVDFDTSPGEINRILDPEKLPWGIAGDAISTNCPDCPAHFGYVIQPLVSSFGTRGIYVVTVRIKRSKEANDYFDTQFYVGTK